MKHALIRIFLGTSALALAAPAIGTPAINFPACDGADAGWCLAEGTNEIDPVTSLPWESGTLIGMDLRPDFPVAPSVGDTGLVAGAITVNVPLVDNAGSSTENIPCPATGSYYITGETFPGSGIWQVQILLNGGCPCAYGTDEPSVNPSVRTILLEVDGATGQPADQQPLANTEGFGNRCNTSVDTFFDWYVGPDATVTFTDTATKTPDTIPVVTTP
jgi:hypothetical protein